MPNFQIIFVDRDKYSGPDIVTQDAHALEKYIFDDAKQAERTVTDHKEWCARLGWTPAKLRIQKIVTAAWEKREAARLTDGTYTPLPDWWRESWWWTENADIHAKHYAHMSEKDPNKIAFTESPEKGEADIQLVLSPTKYLTRFFGENGTGHLNPRAIRDIGALFETGNDYELKMSFSPDDFERIYEAASDVVGEGSSYESCMRYKRDHFELERHPAYAYGAGDLAIAWVEDEDGNILSRANVWPEKKTYVRVYGLNSKYHSLMHTLLKRDGYTHTNDFEGARLLKYLVEEDSGKKHYLCPFIDGNRHRNLRDKGDYFVLGERTRDSFSGETTEGVISVYEMVTCAKTGIRVRGDLITMVDGQPWSQAALDRFETWWCNGTGERTQERCFRVVGQFGATSYFRKSIFDTMDTYMCQCSGKIIDANYHVAIQVNTPKGVETWSSHLPRNTYRRSQKNGLFYARGYYPDKEGTDLSEAEARVMAYQIDDETLLRATTPTRAITRRFSETLDMPVNWFSVVEEDIRGFEISPEDATF